MGREEQIEEREVLDSIFPDEITDVSEIEYRISITLDIPDDGDEVEEQPILVLTVRYPTDYPDEAPILSLSPTPNAAPHPYLNIAEDKDQLLEGLQATIEENLGMAMVFTLVSTLKEAAEQLAIERRESEAKLKEEALLEAEREENKKFHGTMVNRETFTKWRDAFVKEMEDAKIAEEEERLADLKKARIKEPAKLTGRQLWERGLVGKVDQYEEEDDEVPLDEVQKLAIENN